MSDLTSFRSWLQKFGMDFRTFAALLMMGCTAIWGASVKYSMFLDHMNEIDKTQIEIKDSMRRQDEHWNDALKAQTNVLVDQLRQMNAQNVLEQKTLDNRLNTMEHWRSEEEKRDTIEDTAIARIGEQVSATHSDVGDLKNLLENIIIQKRTGQ